MEKPSQNLLHRLIEGPRPDQKQIYTFFCRESWEISRDSVVSFDKASFLSDQPDSHLAFLAAVLETQVLQTENLHIYLILYI